MYLLFVRRLSLSNQPSILGLLLLSISICDDNKQLFWFFLLYSLFLFCSAPIGCCVTEFLLVVMKYSLPF